MTGPGEPGGPTPAGTTGNPADAPDPSDGTDPSGATDARVWADTHQRVEEYLLGGPRRFTRLDVNERSGVPLVHTSRLWSALGFPTADDAAAAFTDADLEALELSGRLLADDAFDEAEELAVARSVGQSMARLAEWQANLVRRTIIDSGRANDPDAVLDAVETLIPIFERLQSYAWRRHLAVTAGRMLAGIAEAPEDREHRDPRDEVVVGFADIVGYTGLSRQVSDTELRSLLERFEAVSTEVVAQHGARVVKMLGDEVLFTCTDVAAACEIAFGLHAMVPDDDARLVLRIGLARGQVLRRYGDVYGPVVNIASRLTSHARPGTVLVDEGLTAALHDAGLGYELRSVPPMSVRGYRHLRPHVVRVR